jgi:7,8-dihydroneopterin aldolase/epimerase/oxygenase
MSEIATYFFRAISEQVSIGLLAAEKAAPQRVLIDLEYDCQIPVELHDEAASVLDYDAVRRDVAAIARSGHFNLQETLCRAILNGLMARPQVLRAKVSVRKPDIYPDVDSVGVTMQERRP